MPSEAMTSSGSAGSISGSTMVGRDSSLCVPGARLRRVAAASARLRGVGSGSATSAGASASTVASGSAAAGGSASVVASGSASEPSPAAASGPTRTVLSRSSELMAASRVARRRLLSPLILARQASKTDLGSPQQQNGEPRRRSRLPYLSFLSHRLVACPRTANPNRQSGPSTPRNPARRAPRHQARTARRCPDASSPLGKRAGRCCPSMRTVSPSWSLPSMMRLATLSTTWRWMRRLSGRAINRVKGRQRARDCTAASVSSSDAVAVKALADVLELDVHDLLDVGEAQGVEDPRRRQWG